VRLRLPILLILLCAAPPLHAAEYDIAAVYDDTQHQIAGVANISFTNAGPTPLSEVHLLLYPNIYLEEDPAIDRAEYRKVYPVRFNPGHLQVASMTGPDGAPLSSVLTALNHKKTLLKVALPTPLPPGAPFSFQVHFVTHIPEKWGVFGHDRHLTTLQGGWHPYLAAQGEDGAWNAALTPPKSRFRVALTLRNGLRWMAAAPATHMEPGEFYSTHLIEADLTPFFPLSIGEGLAHRGEVIGPVQIAYQFREKDRPYADRVLQIARDAVKFFQLEVGPLGPVSLQMAAAPLYQDLTANGAKVLYINTRIFKVAPFLRHYHEASLSRALFLLLYRAYLPNEEAWVLEGLAPKLAEQFMRARHPRRTDLERWLTPIAFIPLADEILYSRSLPFRQIYFNETAIPVLNEDVQTFNHARPGGTLIFSKLGNLLGEKTVNNAVATYRKHLGSAHFREVLYETAGRRLDWFFDQWLLGNPVFDFRIAQITRRKVGAKHDTVITLAKDGAGIEPVEILVKEKSGAKHMLLWKGNGVMHAQALRTNSPVKSVELDPKRRASDLDRSNNRSPAKWKVLLNRFGLSGYNLNTGVVGYKAGLLFRPVYGERGRISLGLSHDETGNTGKIEYAHTFLGHHTVSTGLLYERPETQEGMPPEDTAGIVRLNYAFGYPVPFSRSPTLVKILQRLAGRPSKIGLSLGYGRQITQGAGRGDSVFTAQIDLRKIVAFSNDHEIAFRWRLGASSGRLFENSRFFLGGDDAMRGYRPLVFEGDNLSLVSTEYRFPLRRETGWDLSGAALTHTLQGALFADLGHTARMRDLFDLGDYKMDAGVGIRWWLDFLGLYPTLIRFDVALPIASPIQEEREPHYYLTAGQAF